MGNHILGQTSSQWVNVEGCIKDISELEFEERIKINRFLKTIKAKLKFNGKKQTVVVKVFVLNPIIQPLIKEISISLYNLGQFLCRFPIFSPFTLTYVTDKAGVIIRPYVYENLYDRLVTRPFLTDPEKTWIIYQILKAFELLHKYTPHGDIKLENILITSWNFVIISDLSTLIKPTFLYSDTAVSDFNYFFDTSGRHACYIAPERFINGQSNERRNRNDSNSRGHSRTPSAQDIAIYSKSYRNSQFYAEELETKSTISELNIYVEDDKVVIKHCELLPSMDVFSIGCLIYELMTDGKILFTLSDQIAYSLESKTQEYFHEIVRSNVNDPALADMICHMISREPSARLTLSQYLNEYDKIFKGYFYYLYQNFAYNLAEIKFSETDHFLFYIQRDYQQLLALITSFYRPEESYNTDPGILFILSTCLSCVSTLKLASSKENLIEIMLTLAKYVTDDVIINRILPHILVFCDDEQSCIREKVSHYTVRCLQSIKQLSNIDEANMFSDYIFPKLMKLECDTVLTVRLALVESLPEIFTQAFRFYRNYRLMLYNSTQSEKEGVGLVDVGDELESIYTNIQSFGKAFLTDSSSFVKRLYLQNSFPKINDLLNSVLPFDSYNQDLMLSHSIAVLNNKTDWYLRQSFFDAIPKLIEAIGPACSYVLSPLLQQGLCDSCEWVVCSTLKCIASIVSKDLLPDNLQFEFFRPSLPFLVHPNFLIRSNAVKCIGCHFARVSISDYHINLLPHLKPYLSEEAAPFINYFINPEQLSIMLIKPIPYKAFEVLLNRETAGHFLDFLHKQSEKFFQTQPDTDNTLKDIFEEADDSIISLQNFMVSCNFVNKKDFIRILLLSDYIKSYIREKPSNNFNIDYGEIYDCSVGWPDISILPHIDYDLRNIKSPYSDTSPFIMISAKSERSVADLKDSHKEFQAYLANTAKSCIYNIKKIIENKSERYNTFMYAKDYVTKYAIIDEPPLKIFKEKGNSLNFVSHIQAHNGPITKMKSVPNKGIFVTSSDDCSVKIWNINSLDVCNKYSEFKPIQTYNRMSGRVNTISLLNLNSSSDLTLKIACASHDTSDIQVFEAEMGSSANHTSNLISSCYVDITKDGFVVDLTTSDIYSTPLLLAATLNGAVNCYDVRAETFKNVMRFYAPVESHLTSVECDPYGCWIATSTYNGTVRLWDTRFSGIPIKTIFSANKSPITQIQVSSSSPKKIVCSFGNTIKPVSIINLETGLEEASFSIFNDKNVVCTSIWNISTFSSHHVFFSCTDNLIRNWNVNTPHKSSILVPSLQLVNVIDRISYSTRMGGKSSSLDTRESISIDPRLTKTILNPTVNNNGALYNFCTNVTYLTSYDALIAGLPDGVIRVYK